MIILPASAKGILVGRICTVINSLASFFSFCSSNHYLQIMKNISMPSNHSEVRFTDRDGQTHQGEYREVLKAFVDTEGGKDPDDIRNIYSEDRIIDWQYLHSNS